MNRSTHTLLTLAMTLSPLAQGLLSAAEKPNIIVVFADDISAREFPTYDSTVWTPPGRVKGFNTSDPQYRAQTPVLDELADDGCYAQTAWACPVCTPSRAMMMTGRYAHLHKWWQNNDRGKYINKNGKADYWPLYLSSPNTIGTVAQMGGYRSLWTGKTQMFGDLSGFNFDSILATPTFSDNSSDYKSNTFSDFVLERDTSLDVPDGNKGKKWFRSKDTGEAHQAWWSEASFFWQPFVYVDNVPYGSHNKGWWPNTPESQQAYGLSTYGPDVEMAAVLDFIDQAHQDDAPFFIYHTPHLGHEAFNYLNQPGNTLYPGTPIIHWDGEKYTRDEVNITGDKGNYDTHGTVTDPGIKHHIEYLDYIVWQYREKLEALGLWENTIFIFATDNGTLGYGKMRVERQRGPRVPFFVYAPGMTRHGRQDILVNISDILPTIADIAGVELPKDYEVNGKSLMPYLMGESDTHRDWIYSYLFEKQMIRGQKVLRDGNGNWFDVENEPADLDSYPQITDWSSVSSAHRQEKTMLEGILPRFDKHATEHDAPDFVQAQD